MIRAMVIMILAGLTFLQGYLPDGMAPNLTSPSSSYEFGGMARNPFAYEFCPERYRPKLIPNPSISPTPTRQQRKTTPEPTIEATPTPTPTEDSWTCPAIEVEKRGEYMQVCVPICEVGEYGKCGQRCGDCWKESE